MGPGEEVASDLVLEIHTEVFRSDNVSSDASEGFREGSHVNVHLPFKMEVIRYSTAILAENTISVSIINIGHRIMFLRQLDNVFQRRYVSVHAKDSVSNDEDSAKPFRSLELFLEIAHVFVLVDSPLRLRQTTAIDYAAVVQLIADDQVTLVDKAHDCS